MFSKILTNSKDITLDQKITSLNLNDKEEIIDIEVIDENRLLIIVYGSDSIKGMIYNIKQNKILKIIQK